jgi:DNA-binding transcriptional LysR family regulator
LHPGVRLQMHVGDRALDLVRDEVDLVLRYGVPPDIRIVARTLATPRTVLCAAPAYLQRHGAPSTPQDLVHHDCLTYLRAGQPYRVWLFSRDGTSTRVRVSGQRSVDDAALAHTWAVAGRGILLKTRLELEHELSSGALVPLLTEWTTEAYPLHLLLPSARFVPARVRALVDFLAQKFTAQLP